MHAGINNVNVYHLRVQDGRLIQVGSKHRYPAHMAMMDADKAVDKLMCNGQTVYLYADDDAVTASVKSALRNFGIEV